MNGGPNVGTAVSVLVGGSTIETDGLSVTETPVGKIPDGPNVIAEPVSVGTDPGADPGAVPENAVSVSVGAEPGTVSEGDEPESVDAGTFGNVTEGSTPVDPTVIALPESTVLGLAG